MGNPEKIYSTKDIQVISNPFRLIRRYPKMYTGVDSPTAKQLAELFFDGLRDELSSAHLEFVEGWWFIAAKPDWLVDLTIGPVAKRIPVHPLFAFFHFVPLGVNGLRGEVVLTAFADVLVRCDSEGLHWLVGGPLGEELPQVILQKTHEHMPNGRCIAFKKNDESVS